MLIESWFDVAKETIVKFERENGEVRIASSRRQARRRALPHSRTVVIPPPITDKSFLVEAKGNAAFVGRRLSVVEARNGIERSCSDP
jgi:hypothetical protein